MRWAQPYLDKTLILEKANHVNVKSKTVHSFCKHYFYISGLTPKGSPCARYGRVSTLANPRHRHIWTRADYRLHVP